MRVRTPITTIILVFALATIISLLSLLDPIIDGVLVIIASLYLSWQILHKWLRIVPKLTAQTSVENIRLKKSKVKCPSCSKKLRYYPYTKIIYVCLKCKKRFYEDLTQITIAEHKNI